MDAGARPIQLRRDIFRVGSRPSSVAPGFAALPIPRFHSMARSIVRRRAEGEDHWQISESAFDVKTPGTAPRRVTSCADDYIRPFFLPDDRVVYAKKRATFRHSGRRPAAGKTLQLAIAPGNFLPTNVLRDGRILFEAAYPLGTHGAAELSTIYSDRQSTGILSLRSWPSALLRPAGRLRRHRLRLLAGLADLPRRGRRKFASRLRPENTPEISPRLRRATGSWRGGTGRLHFN